jgi:hypothetical protein
MLKKITIKIFSNYLDLADPDGDNDDQVLVLLLYIDEVIIFHIPETSSSHCDSKVSLLE